MEGVSSAKPFYAQTQNLGSLLKHIYMSTYKLNIKIKNYAYTYTCASMYMCDFFCMCSSSIYIILILYLIFILRVYFNRLP